MYTYLTRPGRKAQEQAASHGDTAHTASGTPHHPWNFASGGDPYYPPLFDLATENAPSPKTRFDDNFDAAAMEDPTSENFTLTSFARPQGNLGARHDSAGDTVTGSNAAGILNDARDLGMRHGFRPDRWAAGSHQYNLHPAAAPMATAGFGQPSARDIMPQQPNNNQQQIHHQQRQNVPSFSDNSNASARAVGGPQSRRCSVPAMNMRADHLENCSECGAQNRQSHQRATRSMGNTRMDTHPNSGLPSPASSASVHDHMSQQHSPSAHSANIDILQEHGIDISQIMSHIDSERRGSTSAPARPPLAAPQPYVRSSEGAVSENNRSGRGRHRQEQWDHPMNLGLAHDNYDSEYIERSGPRVTKVVVIYMDERGQG